MPKERALTPTIIDEFFNSHLPSRLDAVTSVLHDQRVVRRLPQPARRRIQWALIYSAVPMTRMLLEFLGIVHTPEKGLIEKTLTATRPPEAYRRDDVHVEELGGRFVRKADLLAGEEDTLKTFLHMANKVAHFTYDFRVEDGREDGHETIGPAVRITLRLMNEHLYGPTDRSRIPIPPTGRTR